MGKVETGDLDKLIAAVEAGIFDAGETRPVRFNEFVHHFEAAFGLQLYEHAWDAYTGSLDAAKRLHDAQLPGWDWCVMPTGVSVYSAEDNSPIDADIDNPARAWLLAILRAVKAHPSTPGATGS